MRRDRRLAPLSSWLLLAPLAVATATVGVADDRRRDASREAIDHDAAVVDLVIDSEPARRLRLAVWIDGEPWRERRARLDEACWRALFEYLDADRDGLRDNTELRRAALGWRLFAPTQAATGGESETARHVAFNPRLLDRDRDGWVGIDEWLAHASALRVTPVVSLASNGVAAATPPDSLPPDPLFAALDQDRDGAVDLLEWSRRDDLWRLDRDGNRVLTGAELTPATIQLHGPEFVARPLSRPRENVGTRRWLSVRAEAPLSDRWPDASIQVRWRTTPTSGAEVGDGGRETDGTASWTIAASAGELAIAHIELGLAISHPSGTLELLLPAGLADHDAKDFARSWQTMHDRLASKDGVVTVSRPGLERPVRTALRIADEDADGTVSPSEWGRFVAGPLVAWSRARSAHLRLMSWGTRRGLLAEADTNVDGRLGRRELSRLHDRFVSLAGDAGRVGTELPGRAVVMVRWSEEGLGGPLESAAPGADGLAEPEWFASADRNRDGVLDREEFLGRAEQFDRIDRDRDGWIDPREAAHVQAPNR